MLCGTLRGILSCVCDSRNVNRSWQKVDIYIYMFLFQFTPGGYVALRHWVISARNFQVTWWSGNVRHQLPSDVTPHPRRTETLTTPLRKSKFLQFSPIVSVKKCYCLTRCVI